MCVLARDEWRRAPHGYNGLCSLFSHIIHQEGYVETDDDDFNKLLFDFIHPPVYGRRVITQHLIPEFRRPRDANQEAAFWWSVSDVQRRLRFLQELVMYYANATDHEEDEKIIFTT